MKANLWKNRGRKSKAKCEWMIGHITCYLRQARRLKNTLDFLFYVLLQRSRLCPFSWARSSFCISVGSREWKIMQIAFKEVKNYESVESSFALQLAGKAKAKSAPSYLCLLVYLARLKRFFLGASGKEVARHKVIIYGIKRQISTHYSCNYKEKRVELRIKTK